MIERGWAQVRKCNGVHGNQSGVRWSGAGIAAQAVLRSRAGGLIGGPVDNGGIGGNPRDEHSGDDGWRLRDCPPAVFVRTLVRTGTLRARVSVIIDGQPRDIHAGIDPGTA